MFRFYVISLLFAVSLAGAASVDLSPPKNAVGSADVNGHLRYVHRFGDIKFSDNFSIPLRFDFSSERIAAGEKSEFGWHGWGCGAIESRASFLKEGEILKIQLLCAKTMLLDRSESDPNLYFTSDKSWTGTVNGEEISIQREDGWDLVFREGRVDRFTTDKGREISWIRDEAGRVVSVQEKGTIEPQLVLTWGKDGKPSEIDIRSLKYRFVFDGDTLAQIEWEGSGGEARRFLTTQKDDSVHIETSRFRQYYFSWEPKSGILLSDGVNRYRLKEQKKQGNKPGRKTLEMIEPTGDATSLVLGESGGETRYLTADGREIIVTKIIDPGPAYGAVHEVSLAVSEKKGNLILMKNVFDEKGKITQRIWHGNPALFSGYHAGTIEGALLPRSDQGYEIEHYAEKAEKHIIDFVYREDDQLNQVMVNRVKILDFSFDDQDRITKMHFKDRYDKHFTYHENGDETEKLVLSETKTGPFWYLESESKGVGPELVVSSIVNSDGLLLSQEFADGRTMRVEYDKSMRRVRDLTLAPDRKREIRSVSYVYSPGAQSVLRISEDLIRKDIQYSQITTAGVGRNVSGRLLPKEVAMAGK